MPTMKTRVPKVATVDQARIRFRSNSRSASSMPHAAVTEPAICRLLCHQGQASMPASSRASRYTPSLTMVAECR